MADSPPTFFGRPLRQHGDDQWEGMVCGAHVMAFLVDHLPSSQHDGATGWQASCCELEHGAYQGTHLHTSPQAALDELGRRLRAIAGFVSSMTQPTHDRRRAGDAP